MLCEECERIATPSHMTSNVQVKRKKRISKKKAILIAIAVGFVLIFAAIMSTPDIVSIDVTYEGDTNAGVVLDSKNEGFVVIGTDENGDKIELSGWEIENPKTLIADESESVVISFGNCSDTVEVECSTSAVKELIVEYTGDREEGTVVTKESSGLKVTALCKNGEKSDITADCELV